MCEDPVFQFDPDQEGDAEHDVEEAFIGDGEDDECGGERQEDNDESMEVVAVGI